MKNIIKKVLMSGASGLIGSRLRQQFLDNDIIVHSIGRSLTDTFYYDFLNWDQELPKFTIKYDLFIHCAWYTTHPDFWYSENNAAFYFNSLNLITELMPVVDKVVALGSCAEYDIKSSLDTNSYSLGGSKLSLRRELTKLYHEERILWPTIFFAYGEGEPVSKILSQIRSGLINKSTIRDLDSVRDFIHFDDVVFRVMTLIKKGRYGVHDVGTGLGVRIGDLFDPEVRTLYRYHFENPECCDIKVASINSEDWGPEAHIQFNFKLKRYLNYKK